MSDLKFDEKFQDPATGETVTRLKVPLTLLVDLEKNVAVNAQSANNFLQICRQLWQLLKKGNDEAENATKAELAIGKEVLRIREKMNLDSAWVYNIPLKMVEKREPPPETKVI